MEFLSYRWRLAKLQRGQRKDERLYRGLISKAGEEHGEGSSDHQSTLAEWFAIEDANEFSVARLQTSYLRQRAEALLLSVPEVSDETAWKNMHGFHVLSRQARNALKAAIRKEQHEAVQTPLAILGGLTGIGGVIVAIIALLVR